MAFRDISFKAKEAFYGSYNFKQGDTKVVAIENGVSVFLYLHNHLIAERNRTTGAVKITNAGYQTNVTKERLTALYNVSIQQKKGVWYLNGEQWDGKWIYVEGTGDTTSNSPLGEAMGLTALIAGFGDLFGANKTEKNDWKARMLKAGLGNAGLEMPSDWDTLSEDEKERRLNGAIAAIKQ